MDFQTARSVFEPSTAASPPLKPLRTAPPPSPEHASSPTIRTPSASSPNSSHLELPRPSMPTHHSPPSHPSPRSLPRNASDTDSNSTTSTTHVIQDTASDYSDVGDYAADTEFYVPGVNDADPPESSDPSLPLRVASDIASSPFRAAGSDVGRVPNRRISLVSSKRVPAHSARLPRISPARSDLIGNTNFRRLEVDRLPDPIIERAARPKSEGYKNERDDGDGDGMRVHSDGIDDDDDDDGDDDDGSDDDEEAVGVVRQHSNFSRLSAQSWLTVDSAQEVQVAEDVHDVPSLPMEGAVEPPEPQLETPPQRNSPHATNHATAVSSSTGTDQTTERRRDSAAAADKKFAGVPDHDPSKLFDVDVEWNVMDSVQAKEVTEMSVFECCAVLQAGVAAYKKRSFRRYSARRVWLSAECDRLYWTSKKDGLFTDQVKLQRVAKMKCTEREVSIDVTEGYRISLIFPTTEEAGMWVRALSCLIPLQASIRESKGVIPPDKEREDYTLSDDMFNGKWLRDYMAVNSYVVLCAAKGQPGWLGNKLAFSRSDGAFVGLRYIPFKLVPLILRSQEETAVLKRLDHPNVVKYSECLLDPTHGGNYVVFEYNARGTLMDSSKLEGVKPISEKTARELIRDIVNPLEYLHTLRIAHGDVRPDNLFRAVNGSIKLNAIGCITHDFTEIKNVEPVVRARLGAASPAFLAPEQCWLSDAPEAHAKSYAMDVWAVGAVLYFMLFGRVPFGGRTDAAIQESICHGKLRFPRVPETSRKVRSLLKGVLGEKDPKTRIGLSELKEHPWFAEGNTSGVQAGGGTLSNESPRLIVSPAEVDSAVQVSKVRIQARRPS